MSMPEAPSLGRIQVAVASGDALDVLRFSVDEGISALFHVVVVAVAPSPDVDFEAIAGRPARFSLGPLRGWTGVCSQMRQMAAADNGQATYEITIVPTLWLTTQRRNHRIFQQMSEPEIVLQLLREWGIDADVQLSGTYKKREYRVQYGESDFAFISRMLEDAGVSFYFASEGVQSKLVLSDAPQSNPERAAPIPFRDHRTAADFEHVTDLHIQRRARPGKHTVGDYDFRRSPGYKLMQTASAGVPAEAELETFEFVPGSFGYESRPGDVTPVADDRGAFRADEREGALLAQRRLEAERATARTCSFGTNVLDLAPGVVFRVTEHPRAEVDAGRLLVLRSSIWGGDTGERTHQCEAVSADHPYRPERVTPRPKASGVEDATVVGPPGEEIYTDEFGRVRVHFHWDRRSTMDEKSSCWIHVSHPWAGAGFGAVNVPRVGQEVIVDFLGGDPDRPIITGRVYTNLQKVPYPLPANKTQSGWKTNSTHATGGYNEIMLEDAVGKELVRIQAEKDLHRLVKHDEDDTVGNHRTRRVGGSEDVSIACNASETVGINKAVTVGIAHELTVGVAKVENVGVVSAETVGKLKRVEVGGTYNVTVAGPMATSVGTTDTVTVGDVYTLTCGESKITVDKTGHVVIEAADITLKATGPILVEADGNAKVQASGSLKVVGSTVHVN